MVAIIRFIHKVVIAAGGHDRSTIFLRISDQWAS